MKRFDSVFFRLQAILLTQDSIKGRKPRYRFMTAVLVGAAYAIIISRLLHLLMG